MQQRYQCPNCGTPIAFRVSFCPNCGGKLYQLYITVEETSEKLDDLLWKLARIGGAKNVLPLSQRGWCNDLGLYVQVVELGLSTHGFDGLLIEAGTDMWVPKLKAVYSFRDERWDVLGYESGDWEKLVEPSVEVARWLLDRGGVREEEVEAFNKAIRSFHKCGRLELP